MKIYILIILSAVFFRCATNSSKFEKKDVYVFKTNFEASFRYSGSFVDAKTNTDYLYFADPMTTKCLKFFNLKGVLTDSIPLQNVMKFIGELSGLSVKSRDTIIFTSSFTNLLAVINSKGDFIVKTKMNNYIKNKEGDSYELYSSFLSKTLFSDYLILHNEWRYNEFDTVEKTDYEDVINFNNKNMETPYFCKIKDYCTDTPKVKFGFYNFYKTFCGNTECFNDLPKYTCENNKIFLNTIYTNKLYIINAQTLDLEKTVDIKSKYTKIGTSPIKLNKKNLNIQNQYDSIMATTGQLFDLFYDKENVSYLLYVYHAVPLSLEKEIGYKKLPFSILKMDTTFTHFKEFKMDANKYYGGFSIMTRKGLLINTPSDKTKDDETYTTFTSFDFKE